MAPTRPHSLYSLSKSFTSTASASRWPKGCYRRRPRPEVLPRRRPGRTRARTSRRCASGTCSHEHRPPKDTTRTSSGARTTTGPRPSCRCRSSTKPGTWFVYNTAATYMLSAIITKLTGETLLDYLRPRLFDPLGIDAPTWETDPQRHQHRRLGPPRHDGGHRPFRPAVPAEGHVAGQAARPEAWIAEATQRQLRQQQHPDEPRLGRSATATSSGAAATWLPRRRRLRPVLHRHARAGCGPRHQQRRAGHASGTGQGLGAPAARHAAGRRCPPIPSAHGELRDKLANLSLPLPRGTALLTQRAATVGQNLRSWSRTT